MPRSIVCGAALLVALAASPERARAHGTIPTSNSISFGPDDGAVLLGTNFGGVLDLAGGDARFICERLVTGEQTSVDVWLRLASGGVAAIVTTGGFIRGVYASDEDACGFTIVPGTEPLLMVDLVADPEDPRGFWAVGEATGDAAGARLVRRAQAGVEELARHDGKRVAGVRAAGAHAYTIFFDATEAHLLHVGPDGLETFVHARVDDEVLRPLGVDPATPTTLWVVGSTTQRDMLYRSVDAGETLTPVLEVAARLGGFAIDGASVWVQSPQKGVHRSTDGGVEFAPLPGSPHGSCLARAPDGRLFACGVPWQDAMVLGVSVDGATFTPVLAYFDGIVGALDCDDEADTALCAEELTFLRAYYGFSDPAVVEGAEVVESSVEPSVETGPEAAAEAGVEVERDEARGSDDGCGAGSSGPLVAAWATMFLALAARGRHLKKASWRGGRPVRE
ncbi:MAG: hypothetical protein IT385_03160 [Deltaproteobacteria bacterium]|nr:hypothetical protein [Deltaproteobacteria bacterium]